MNTIEHKKKINSSWYTSTTDEWATPQKVFDELNAEFHFDLDPCSSDENCKCDNHYTMAQDGLSQDWGGAFRVCQSSIQ